MFNYSVFSGVSNVDNFSHLKELWASVENYYDAEQSDETFVQLKQPGVSTFYIVAMIPCFQVHSSL